MTTSYCALETGESWEDLYIRFLSSGNPSLCGVHLRMVKQHQMFKSGVASHRVAFINNGSLSSNVCRRVTNGLGVFDETCYSLDFYSDSRQLVFSLFFLLGGRCGESFGIRMRERMKDTQINACSVMA